MWTKGQPWRVVCSLDRLNAQIRAACPRAVPPATSAASWGSIADSAHSTSSDHYPHYYSALGGTAVVCARDFPHAPNLGLDAHAIAEQLRISRDSRIGYVISNGRITGPGHDWRWDPYSGSDPHDTHIHVSSVHTTAADDPSDWQIGQQPQEDDMPEVRDIWLGGQADLIQRYNPDGSPVTSGNTHMTAGYALGWAVREAGVARAAAARIEAGQRAILAAIQGVDTDTILAEIRRVAEQVGQVDDQVLAGLGTRQPADVAAALVAAGQDPAALAAELTRLAAP